MIYALALAAVIAAYLAWRFYRGRTWQRGWIIGPIVGGKNYSRGMPLRPDKTPTGWRITIKPGSKVDAVLTDCNGISGSIRARYRITGSVAPFEQPNEPPLVGLYFQRKGDDWAAGRETQFYRWYGGSTPFVEGEHDVTVPLTPDKWGSVYGVNGADVPDKFAAAMAEAAHVGLTFGWSAGASHGVTGDATFELLEWGVA